MGYQPLEELLPRSGYSVYKLVRMAAHRAAELADGRKRLIEKVSSEKTATVALEEIQAGMVELRGVREGQPKTEKAKAVEEPKEE